jgi:hypothetical protein
MIKDYRNEGDIQHKAIDFDFTQFRCASGVVPVGDLSISPTSSLVIIVSLEIDTNTMGN